MQLSWTAFNNTRLLLMACMPVIIFYLIWLINTSEVIRNEEGTLLDLVCWPDGNGIPAVVSCCATVAIVIEIYGLYQLFKASLSKSEYDVTNGFYYYLWGLIIIIIMFLTIMFYCGLQSTIIRAKIRDGITKAMLRYANHLPSKVAIDRLQTKFRCCGRVNYQEWFYIPWFIPQASRTDNIAVRKFVGDNVPYSCCSMDVMWPCIHHGVTHMGTIYKYNPTEKLTIWETGCEDMLISEMLSVSWRFNAVMALIVMAMVLQIIAVRYLHTAYKNGLNCGNRVSCYSYLLRSTDSEVRRSRKLLRQARTTQWVTAYCPPSSSSDDGSSTELLKSTE